jgi:AraC-like DNA-binding protein
MPAPEIIANPEPARGLEQALVEALVACIAAPDLQNDSVSPHRRHAIMRRFYALLEEWADEAAYVAELCVAMGVSHRTLRSCCQEHLGMGPKQFLLQRRMHMAHRALRESDMAKTSVTDIATQYGFWEFGRFAVAYKSMFGELPSVTLRYSRPLRRSHQLAGDLGTDALLDFE